MPDMQDQVREMLYFNILGGNAYVKSDLVNLMTILSHDTRWKGKIRKLGCKYVCENAPWHEDDAPAVGSMVLSKTDRVRLRLWLIRYYAVDFSLRDIDQALSVVAEHKSTNI